MNVKSLRKRLLRRRKGAEKSRLKKILFLGLFLLAVYGMHAQSRWVPGVSYYHGAMFRYLKSQPWLLFTGLQGAELMMTKKTAGEKAWHSYYNYPDLKLGLSYFDYGNPKVFGQFITGVAGLNFGFAGNKKITWSPGFGLGYSTRYFTEYNRENRAVSTRISFVAELDLKIPWELENGMVGSFNLAMRHASNGNIKKPNYGMNFVALGISAAYDPQRASGSYVDHNDSEELGEIHHFLVYSMGWKDPRVSLSNRLYQVQAISYFASYRFSNINSFLAGIDGMYDTSQYEEYINQTKETPPFDPEDFDKRQLAFTFGNIFHFGKLGIISQAGIFLYRPYDFMKFSYQRYGFQYAITDHVIAQSALKAYFGSADLVEFGLGVRL